MAGTQIQADQDLQSGAHGIEPKIRSIPTLPFQRKIDKIFAGKDTLRFFEDEDGYCELTYTKGEGFVVFRNVSIDGRTLLQEQLTPEQAFIRYKQLALYGEDEKFSAPCGIRCDSCGCELAKRDIVSKREYHSDDVHVRLYGYLCHECGQGVVVW